MSPTLNGVNRSKVLQMKWPPRLAQKHQQQSVGSIPGGGKVISGSQRDKAGTHHLGPLKEAI